MNLPAWCAAHAEAIWLGLAILLNLAGIACNILRARRKGLTSADFLRLAREVCRFEAEAEALTELSAAEKLEYVLTRLRRLTEEMGCRFDAAVWSAQIERDLADPARGDGETKEP